MLETFICRYAETLEEFDFSSYPGRQDLFAIRRKETGRLIGIVNFFDEKDGSCEIGYGILEEHQGQGYATEAVQAACRWEFQHPEVTALEAETDPGNAPSHRVLEKCGFLPNGIIGEEGPRFSLPRWM